jgi:hypothetical protein
VRKIPALALLVTVAGACAQPPPSATPPALPSSAPPPASAASGGPVDPGELDAYSAFRGRVGEAPARFGQFVRSLSSALGSGPGAVAAATAAIRTWATAEQAWLAPHDPAGCYGDAVTAYRRALEATVATAVAFDALAAEASPPPADADAAVALLGRTGDAFDSVVDVTADALEACR